VFEVFLAFEVVFSGAFAGAGDTVPPFLVIFPITFLRVPLAFLFGIVFGMGVNAIWFVIALTTFFKGIILYFLFRRGSWAKKKV